MAGHDDELIEVHHERIAALVAGDLDALDAIVGDDLVFVNANGRSMRKPEIFAAFKAGTMSVQQIDSSDIEVRRYGDTAILAYRALTTVQDGDNLIDGLTQNTCVFVHRDGRWQMVSQHQCSVAA
ncbi:MAG: nuclear transport factor 2 family protein [Pseudomonadota bacterium]